MASRQDDMMKKDDDEYYVPLQTIDRSAVIQESRIFNDVPVQPSKCAQVLSKLLYVLSTSNEPLSKVEATNVFFNVTKLFQSDNVVLRRLLYVVIKELKTSSDDVIIAVNSLAKDMNSTNDLFRANALRTLCAIIDASMLASLERHLKQAIVDRDTFVASAALVGSLRIKNGGDVIKRWSNEAQEVLNSKSTMVQYHALTFLYQVKQGDKLAVNKLVSGCVQRGLRSPHAHCALIRIISEAMRTQTLPEATERSFLDYLESCLRHKSEMVIFEAARSIATIPHATARELTPAVSVLQLFLSSSKPVLRFAAIRTLNEVASHNPSAVSVCNLEMEGLVGDSNRNIATLAITTLLRTGSETSVDRLMKQISTFLADISDEFKIVVVEAIRSMCLKFPAKHRVLLAFLSQVLREEGGFEYKKAIVESIIVIIERIPEALPSGLGHLAEFIEDCEFSPLSTRILHLLGRLGPQTGSPAKYIRYIYNRVLLENSTVRAAAVSALANFGLEVPKLRPSVITLLRRCLFDNDDEVRDRSILSIEMLQALEGTYGEGSREFWSHSTSLNTVLHDSSSLERLEADLRSRDDAKDVFNLPQFVSANIDRLAAKQALSSTLTPASGSSTTGPSAASSGSASAAGVSSASSTGSTSLGPSSSGAPAARPSPYEAVFAKIAEFKSLGRLLVSSKPAELTESEMEYQVSCIKHVFPEHLVLQFNVTNTVEQFVLENVHVDTETSALADLNLEWSLPVEQLKYNQPEAVYVAFRRDLSGESPFPVGEVPCKLRFIVKEIDEGTVSEDGYEDEYPLESLEVSVGDYIRRSVPANFQAKWDEFGDSSESSDTFALSSQKSLQSAIDAVLLMLGLTPLADTKVGDGKKSFKVQLAGEVISSDLGDDQAVSLVLAIAHVFFDTENRVNLELKIRSATPEARNFVQSAIV